MPASKRKTRAGAKSVADPGARAKRARHQNDSPPPSTALDVDSELTETPSKPQKHPSTGKAKPQGKALVDPVGYLGPQQGDTDHSEISRRLQQFALTTVTNNATVWPRVIWQAIYQFTPPPRHGDFFALPLRGEWAPLVNRKVLIRLHKLLDKTILVDVVESYAQDTGDNAGKVGRARNGRGGRTATKKGILKLPGGSRGNLDAKAGAKRRSSGMSVTFADEVDKAGDSIAVDTSGKVGLFARRSKLVPPKRSSNGAATTTTTASTAGPSSNTRNGADTRNGNGDRQNSPDPFSSDNAPLPRKTTTPLSKRTTISLTPSSTPYAIQAPLAQDLPPAPLLLTVRIGPAGDPNFILHLHYLAEVWADLREWHTLMLEGGDEKWPGALDVWVEKRLLFKAAVKFAA